MCPRCSGRKKIHETCLPSWCSLQVLRGCRVGVSVGHRMSRLLLSVSRHDSETVPASMQRGASWALKRRRVLLFGGLCTCQMRPEISPGYLNLQGGIFAPPLLTVGRSANGYGARFPLATRHTTNASRGQTNISHDGCCLPLIARVQSTRVGRRCLCGNSSDRCQMQQRWEWRRLERPLWREWPRSQPRRA